MKQIKVFQNDLTANETLEQKVNEWLKTSQAEVIQIETRINSGEGAKHYPDRAKIVITILYQNTDVA